MFKKILVTGGCGFIGSNFIHHILENHDTQIVNLDKLTYSGNKSNLKKFEKDKRYTLIEADICDVEEIHYKIGLGVDCIVNFAAESHVDRSIKDASSFISTNIEGTRCLLEYAKRIGCHFHHISTDEVFGSIEEGFFDEKTPYSPRNPYSASKAASDHLVMSYFYTHELPVTISNCSNNYGPYQFPEKLIPLAITNVIRGRKIPVYGDGQNIRDWIHVRDHCRAIEGILIKGKSGESYCIGGDSEKKNLEVVKIIAEAMGKNEKDSFIFVEDRKGHDKRYAIDFSKTEKEIGWSPSMNFEKGIKETIEWYQNHRRWWKEILKGNGACQTK